MKYFLIPLAFLGIILLSFALERPVPKASPSMQPQTSQVEIGTTTVSVEVADTPAKRAQGLSGRIMLSQGRGMLFVFEREGNWGFWMKDMQFSLDIIWAKSDGTIITIASHVAPETYPSAFYPTLPEARFVLEVPAGFVEAHGIAEGMRLVL